MLWSWMLVSSSLSSGHLRRSSATKCHVMENTECLSWMLTSSSLCNLHLLTKVLNPQWLLISQFSDICISHLMGRLINNCWIFVSFRLLWACVSFYCFILKQFHLTFWCLYLCNNVAESCCGNILWPWSRCSDTVDCIRAVCCCTISEVTRVQPRQPVLGCLGSAKGWLEGMCSSPCVALNMEFRRRRRMDLCIYITLLECFQK